MIIRPSHIQYLRTTIQRRTRAARCDSVHAYLHAHPHPDSHPHPHPTWEPVIGLEVHAQLTSVSKLFSSSKAVYANVAVPPNSCASWIDSGFPGQLPTLNVSCLLSAIKLGLSLGGTISDRESTFNRKHYFYPDMPQGYQITQQQHPIVLGGSLLINEDTNTRVRISRIQLEQDSARAVHDLSPVYSHMDMNRCGVALVEIVTEPDIHSADEAQRTIRVLTSLLSTLGVSKAQMEDGSLRVDVNISIREKEGGGERRDRGRPVSSGRVEVKNLNSLRSVVRAIDYEFRRQCECLNGGIALSRETRTFDVLSGETRLLRSKENLLDYRFMPEPDLPAVIIDRETIQHIKQTMPETPRATIHRLHTEYGLSLYDSTVLVNEPDAVPYFYRVVHGETFTFDKEDSRVVRNPKTAVNWLTNELFGRIKKRQQTDKQQSLTQDADIDTEGGNRYLYMALNPVKSHQLASLIDCVEAQIISGKQGKQILDIMLDEGEQQPSPTHRPALSIIEEKGWKQINNQHEIEQLCQDIIRQQENEIREHIQSNKDSRHQARFVSYLSGLVVKASHGRANPTLVANTIKQHLEERAKQMMSTHQADRQR